MEFNKSSYFKIFIIFLISTTFFLGYYLRENSVGGGEEFYELSWPIIQGFKENFLFTLKNYGLFRDYTIPFSHIINAYLNPFSNNVSQFQLSITIISFFIFVIYFYVIKKLFKKLAFFDAMLTSSIILLLPFFRTSAFWGKNENFGWLFFILALYFFSKIKKDISENSNNVEIFNVVFFCLASSCALYARQALAFLPISYFLYLFFCNANRKIIIFSFISFFILSIPSILLIVFWGNIFEVDSIQNHTFFSHWIHPRNILKNIPILLSFFAFYLIPFLIIEFFEYGYKAFIKKYIKSFLFAFVIFLSLSQFGLLNYLGEYTSAGGAVLKINYLILKNNFLLLLLFSSIGFGVLVCFFKEDVKNNVTFLVPLLIIYCFPELLYQEYAEPLILIVFFLALKTDLHKTYLKNIIFSNFVLLSYFGIYLIGSIYFKHFAFSSYHDWIMFLNAQ